MQNPKISVEPIYQTAVVVWAALLSSQFLFLAMIFFVRPGVFRFDFARPLAGDDPLFVSIFAPLALIAFAASIVLRKRLVSRAVAQQNVGMVQSAMIVGCALCEAVSLLGLMLVFLQNYQYFFLFFALAIFGFILHFPRRDDFMAAGYKK
jgi:F0F1-type ATP synthase membrane subunit c/vacuolar-type H+-ATPase subunit K